MEEGYMEGTSHKNLQAVYHAFPPMARGNFAKRGKLEFVSLKENIDTATPQGRFMLTVFGALAEMERENILERQREGIEIAKGAGKHKD
ncbi:MAG: recombinase family protein [Oscillospiraceae bacterium]|jgi:hypothetical protein|nr:recombinase family protein [Oscillospiraceae bacterium]MCI9390989.1 recombinase family protein [Oscillospiraceae bacterium]